MIKYLTILAMLISFSANATDCSELTHSGDGVPAIYYQEKCMAEKAFDEKKYSIAAEHYKNALAVKIFEAPNYELRLERAKSLCLSGKFEEGQKVLKSFVLMAKADLGEFKCPKNMQEVIGSEHKELACIGYGSSLSDKGKASLRKKLENAKEVEISCKNNYQVAEKFISSLLAKSPTHDGVPLRDTEIKDLDGDGINEILLHRNEIEENAIGYLNQELYESLVWIDVYKKTGADYELATSQFKEFNSMRKAFYFKWLKRIENKSNLNINSKNMLDAEPELFQNKINEYIARINSYRQ